VTSEIVNECLRLRAFSVSRVRCTKPYRVPSVE
jgi:hypothetical protein